ncbi:MAG: transglutaminase domain-containing protein [Clostridiales bacterium]|nr:transglutaminase domain-containing protein [Clostridiales bacterium]
MQKSASQGLKAAVLSMADVRTTPELIWEAVLSFLCLAGLLLTAAECCDMIPAQWPVVLLCAALPAGMLLAERKRKTRALFYLLPLLCIAGILLFSFKSTVNGFLIFYNYLMDVFGASSGRIMTRLSLWQAESPDQLTWWFLTLAAALSLPVVWSIRRRNVFPLLLGVCSAGLLCMTGKDSSLGWTVLTISMGAVLLRCFSGYRGGTVKGSVRRLTVNLGTAVLSLILCLSLVSSGWALDFSDERRTVLQMAGNVRYGGSKVLPEGDFSRLGDFAPLGQVHLEVVMSEPDSCYLRGFVGSVYTGRGWERMDSRELYQNAGLFYWLHQDGFYGQTQLAALAQLVSPEEPGRITVKNIGASSRYLYAPYEVLSADGDILSADGIGDEALCSPGLSGQKVYSAGILPNQVRRYTSLAAALHDSEQDAANALTVYRNDEAHYNEYVYANYLDVPEEVRHVLQSLLGEYDTDGERHLSYGTAKQNILNFLTSTMTYSTQIEPAENRRDFVSAFWQETRSGYSVHFATAAALMFRYYGIPARYVEGYLITPEDVEGVLSNSSIPVSDTRAHAWAEFYQDGVGWIPFETTPPYLNMMETADELSGVPAESPVAQGKESEEKEQPEAPSQSGGDEMQQMAPPRMWSILLVLMAAALLTAAIIITFLLLLRRRRRLGRLLRSFESKDLRSSVLSLFRFSVGLWERRGILTGTNTVYDGEAIIKKQLGEVYARQYGHALALYEKARFGRRPVTEPDRQSMKDFMERTVDLYREQRSRAGQFIDRYIRYLYR